MNKKTFRIPKQLHSLGDSYESLRKQLQPDDHDQETQLKPCLEKISWDRDKNLAEAIEGQFSERLDRLEEKLDACKPSPWRDLSICTIGALIAGLVLFVLDLVVKP